MSDAAGLTGAIKLQLHAPVQEAPLERVLLSAGNAAVLRFRSIPGQVLLLLKSSDGAAWRNLATATARGSTTDFYVHPAPADGGPQYRVIIIDRSFR